MQTHLILKYFEGETLTKRLKKTGPMSEDQARLLVQNIALTLKYCHEIGVSHRDIKTDNVLINDLGQITGMGRHFGVPRAYLLTPVDAP